METRLRRSPVLGLRRRRSEGEAEVALRRAELEAERLARLQSVAANLAEALTPHEVLRVVVEYGVQAAEAVAGLIGLVSDDGETIEIVAEHGYPPGHLDAWRTFPVVADVPLSRVVQTGEPLFLESVADRNEHFPELAGRPSRGD